MGAVFDDGKADDALRTIGELSKALGIPTHVLRYWEAQFPSLNPLKRSGGRRYYRSEDVRLVETIDRLVNREGYTLKGARKSLGAAGVTSPSVNAGSGVDPAVIEGLKAIRARLAAALET